jgi:hypothetical protein
MARTLTIGGTNYLPQYLTGSFKIKEQTQNKGNVMNMTIIVKTGQTPPKEGKEIVFKDGSRFLFGGFITKLEPTETGAGELFRYEVEASDYTYILINKIAARVYKNKTLAYIVDDLMDTYVDAGYGMDYATYVQTGPTIETIGFNYISLRSCFEKLTNLTGYIWWVDYEKKLHFVLPETTLAPESITEASANFSDIGIHIDTTQVRNSIVVIGGKEETVTPQEDIFIIASTTEDYWLLRDKPKTMVSIELDTGGGYVTKTYGVDPLDDDGANDFMFNFQEKFVRLGSGAAALSVGNKVRVTYYYEVPILTPLEEATSVLAMKALEGGDGRHKYVIKDSSIKSKKEARNRALKELEQYADPLVVGTFYTRTGLLLAGSYFTAGQQITVNLPTWGITVNTVYLIQEVEITTLAEDTGTIEYQYRVTFGGKLLGLQRFLESLAEQEVAINEDSEVDTVWAVAENLSIAESITRNGLVQSLSESLSIAESISKTNTTPPFKWAASGTKQAIWGKFEWG